MPKFSVSGLRGPIGDELTPDDFLRVANAYARFLGAGKMLISRDARISGVMLEAQVTSGVLAAGCEVIKGGMITTPTSVFATKVLNLNGGITITASHNPQDENGMKFLETGRFLVPQRMAEFSSFASGFEFRKIPVSGLKEPKEVNALELHKKKLLELFGSESFEPRLRVGLDPVNGAAGPEAKEILEALNCEVHVVNFESTGRFGRGGEPLKENLEALSALVKEKRLDAGFAFDPDGDRLAFVDEQGRVPGEEYTVPLCSSWALDKSVSDLVVNLSTSRLIEHVAKEYKTNIFRTPVGEAHVVDKLLETGGVAGGEGNGGFIYPSFNATRDGLLAMTVLASLRRRSGSLASLVDSLPVYFMKKDKLHKEFSPRIRERVLQLFPSAQKDTRDGLWLGDEDFWLHLRPSNTEPVTRIIVEANTKERSEKILNEVKKICAA